MTGRDLIIYILQHNLENEEVLKDGIFLGFMTAEQIAAKFNVGVATILLWHDFGWIDGVKLGDTLYFLSDLDDPRGKTN